VAPVWKMVPILEKKFKITQKLKKDSAKLSE